MFTTWHAILLGTVSAQALGAAYGVQASLLDNAIFMRLKPGLNLGNYSRLAITKPKTGIALANYSRLVITRPSLFDAGTATSYTYFRVTSTERTAGDFGGFGLAEVIFKDAAGAAYSRSGATATASQIHSSTYDAPKAIDGDAATFWTTGSGGTPIPGWHKTQFGSGIGVNYLELQSRPDTHRADDTIAFHVDGSNDGTNWTRLYTTSGLPGWTAGEIRSFIVNPAAVPLALKFSGTAGATAAVANEGSAAVTVSERTPTTLGNTVVKHYATSMDCSAYDDQGVSVSEDASLFPTDGANPYCIEGWIYPTDIAGSGIADNNFIFTSRPDGAGNAKGFQCTLKDTGEVGFAAWDSGQTLLFEMLSGTTKLANLSWYHIAAQRDANKLWTLYINGTAVATHQQTATEIAHVAGTNLDIGHWSVDTSRYFVGHIDSVRITRQIVRYAANFTPLPL